MKRALDVTGVGSASSLSTQGAVPGGINPHSGRPYSSRYFQILEGRKKLPVWEQREEFFGLRLCSLNATPAISPLFTPHTVHDASIRRCYSEESDHCARRRDGFWEDHPDSSIHA